MRARGNFGEGTLRPWPGLARVAFGALLFTGLVASCVPPDEVEAPVVRRTPRSSKPFDPFGAAAGDAGEPTFACGDTEAGFDAFMMDFGSYAVSQRVSAHTVESALGAVTYDPQVIALDRSQRAFKVTFEEFYAKHVTAGRLARGRALLQSQGPLFARIEARFGVPAPVVAAIWGLETEYGRNTGSMSCFRALATLAYDCRRSARFRGELLAALRIVDRGDLPPEAMRGAWAGELGQTQFLPSSYEKFAIDFDGDRRADLIGSSADALASTAHYLEGHGWKPHEGFEAGSVNFQVLGEWNASEVYRRTIVAFAKKLGAK